MTTPGCLPTAKESGRPFARTWQVPLQFCHAHWVQADERLVRAMIGYPLAITVFREEPSKRPARGSNGRDDRDAEPQVAHVALGTAEVDLTPLLMVRPGSKQPHSRCARLLACAAALLAVLSEPNAVWIGAATAYHCAVCAAD